MEVTDVTTTRALAAVRPLVEAATAIGDQLDTNARATVAAYLADVAKTMESFIETPRPRTGIPDRPGHEDAPV